MVWGIGLGICKFYDKSIFIQRLVYEKNEAIAKHKFLNIGPWCLFINFSYKLFLKTAQIMKLFVDD
jgi:hypothetical protein